MASVAFKLLDRLKGMLIDLCFTLGFKTIHLRQGEPKLASHLGAKSAKFMNNRPEGPALKEGKVASSCVKIERINNFFGDHINRLWYSDG